MEARFGLVKWQSAAILQQYRMPEECVTPGCVTLAARLVDSIAPAHVRASLGGVKQARWGRLVSATLQT